MNQFPWPVTDACAVFCLFQKVNLHLSVLDEMFCYIWTCVCCLKFAFKFFWVFYSCEGLLVFTHCRDQPYGSVRLDSARVQSFDRDLRVASYLKSRLFCFSSDQLQWLVLSFFDCKLRIGLIRFGWWLEIEPSHHRWATLVWKNITGGQPWVNVLSLNTHTAYLFLYCVCVLTVCNASCKWRKLARIWTENEMSVQNLLLTLFGDLQLRKMCVCATCLCECNFGPL